MKTAMQELIKFIDYELGFKWDDDTNQKFKELLEKEKEQMELEFSKGYDFATNESIKEISKNYKPNL